MLGKRRNGLARRVTHSCSALLSASSWVSPPWQAYTRSAYLRAGKEAYGDASVHIDGLLDSLQSKRIVCTERVNRLRLVV